MPSHPIHITMDEILFGRGVFFPDVHKYMDRMQPYFQANHRKYFHDMQTVYDIYYMTGNKTMALSAYFHILLDLVSDTVGQDHAVAELTEKIKRGEIQLW
jgi:hypothetical protein